MLLPKLKESNVTSPIEESANSYMLEEKKFLHLTHNNIRYLCMLFY